jgi:hypothetical protein
VDTFTGSFFHFQFSPKKVAVFQQFTVEAIKLSQKFIGKWPNLIYDMRQWAFYCLDEATPTMSIEVKGRGNE